MEDISRELEKEIIASTRYSPVKRRIKSKFFLIDDLGEIKPARWLKAFLWFLSSLSIIAIIAVFSIYYFYSEIRTDKTRLAAKLAASDKKISSLTKEKEILMARLVISGKLPHDFSEKKHKTVGNNLTAVQSDLIKKRTLNKNLSKRQRSVILKKNNVPEEHLMGKKKIYLDEKISEKKGEIINTGKLVPNEPLNQDAVSFRKKENIDGKKYNEDKKYEKISVEDFKIISGAGTGDLLLRFNIRNISVDSENISGRIFVILKPDWKKTSWLVVPGVALKDGKPAAPQRGQYFSIARFKAVHFRVKSNSVPDSFKKASVFVYHKNKLILIREINIKKHEK